MGIWKSIGFHRDYLIYVLVVIGFSALFVYLNNWSPMGQEMSTSESRAQFSQIAMTMTDEQADIESEIRKLMAGNDCYVLLDEHGSTQLVLGDSLAGREFAEVCAKQTFDKNVSSFLEKIENETWVCDSMVLPNLYVVAKSQPLASQLYGKNMLIFIIGFSSIVFVGIIQYLRSKKMSIFDMITNKLMGRYIGELTPYEMNSNKALMSIHLSFIGVIFYFLMYQFAINDDPQKILLYTGAMFLSCILVVGYVSRRTIEKISLPLVLIAVVTPFVLHILIGGFDGNPTYTGRGHAGGMGNAFVWMLPGMLLGLFLLENKASRLVYYLYVILLFLDLLIEVFIWKNPAGTKVFEFINGMFFLGFGLFSSLELYVNRSTASYQELESVYKQLRDTQSLLVQREKVGMLGQLIAGIAHEINTPIGAIKASAESLSAAVLNTSVKLLEEGRTLTDDDRQAFYKLVEMATVAINEMKGTVELRKSKKQLHDYLEDMGIPHHQEITDLLYRMEICEIEKVETNIDLFRKDNILDILRLLCSMTPFITGTQTILFATGRVSKIVFALKSYVHNSADTSRTFFDLTANVENVLVLCHNQLKKGITVIRDIDDIPPVCGNPDELGQVWTNLVQNSIYAMDEVGTLTISIQMANAETVVVTIGDTGSGIPPESLSRIFEPLYTTKPLGEGSGLGLDICKRIIQSHNGTIEVESQSGVGTKFHVLLPVNRQEEQQTRSE